MAAAWGRPNQGPTRRLARSGSRCSSMSHSSTRQHPGLGWAGLGWAAAASGRPGKAGGRGAHLAGGVQHFPGLAQYVGVEALAKDAARHQPRLDLVVAHLRAAGSRVDTWTPKLEGPQAKLGGKLAGWHGMARRKQEQGGPRGHAWKCFACMQAEQAVQAEAPAGSAPSGQSTPSMAASPDIPPCPPLLPPPPPPPCSPYPLPRSSGPTQAAKRPRPPVPRSTLSPLRWGHTGG